MASDAELKALAERRRTLHAHGNVELASGMDPMTARRFMILLSQGMSMDMVACAAVGLHYDITPETANDIAKRLYEQAVQELEQLIVETN